MSTSLSAQEFAAMLIERLNQDPGNCELYTVLQLYNDSYTTRGSGATIELFLQTFEKLFLIHSPVCPRGQNQ